MKNIPMFTTQNGAASLTLEEIPYTATAYIHIRATESPEQMVEECVSFCRACGAERIFAAGHEYLNRFPVYAALYEMRGKAIVDTEMLQNLFPVTEETADQWRTIYNRSMRDVDGARTLTAADEKRIATSGGTYFIHQSGKLLGIGWIEDDTLLAIAAVEPGAGRCVMNTLMSVVEGAQIRLEVASTNTRAIHLYEKMGFLKTREIIRWHLVCK